jgi:light-regulated signal transduction histidine kinase (bacteriophytochrome)
VISSLHRCVQEDRATWTEEYRFLKKDGTYASIRDQGFLIKGPGERNRRMIGAMVDLSEKIATEEKIRALTRELETRVQERTWELEAANKELESFSYSVSHDLRAPLRAIEGFTRILMEDYVQKLDGEGQRFLKLINSSCHQMAELIEDLLTLSRLGRQKTRFVTVDMTAVVKGVVEETLRNSKWNGEVQCDPMPDTVADPVLIRQVWSNLVGNAVKFTSKTEKPRIRIGGVKKGKDIEYFVEDNGAGFEMKYAGKLFGVFQRLHGAAEFEGHGVGLAIVQRLVHRHGGQVGAQAEPNKGAKFTFALPKKVLLS